MCSDNDFRESAKLAFKFKGIDFDQASKMPATTRKALLVIAREEEAGELTNWDEIFPPEDD